MRVLPATRVAAACLAQRWHGHSGDTPTRRVRAHDRTCRGEADGGVDGGRESSTTSGTVVEGVRPVARRAQNPARRKGEGSDELQGWDEGGKGYLVLPFIGAEEHGWRRSGA